MESVELEESIEMRCTLYEQFAYEDEYETRPAVMALSNDERRKQRERDKEDFLEWLWLSPLAGGMAGDVGRDELNRLRQFAKANGLVRGRDPHYRELEELIKEAVEDDLIVPVIDRTDQFGSGYLPPATSPQASPLSDGLLRASAASFAPLSGEFSNREPILSGPYDPAMQESLLKAARSASGGAGGGGSSGFDWMGIAGAAAGAIFGGATTDSDESPGLLAKSFGNTDGAGSLLGDAQPFEYVPDALSDDVMELAASTNKEDYAAKMLGMDRKAFRKVVHIIKKAANLRGDENVVWHDNGDVYYKDVYLDNMFDYDY